MNKLLWWLGGKLSQSPEPYARAVSHERVLPLHISMFPLRHAYAAGAMSNCIHSMEFHLDIFTQLELLSERRHHSVAKFSRLTKYKCVHALLGCPDSRTNFN